MTHDMFTGSAGADRSTVAGWSHTPEFPAPDQELSGPARRITQRARHDRSFPVVWFLVTVGSLLILAALTKPAVTLALWLLGLLP